MEEMIKSKEFQDLKNKVDKIYFALMPNELLQTGGLVSDMKGFKKEIEGIKQDIHSLKEKNIKLTIYQTIMWTAGGAIIGLIAAYILQILGSK